MKRLTLILIFLLASLPLGEPELPSYGWGQISTSEVGLKLAGSSITLVLEQDGSFDVTDGSDLTAILNSFTTINSVSTSSATVTDGGTIDLPSNIDSDAGAADDGQNRIYFFNVSSGDLFGVLAFSAVWFTSSGTITDCDIAFNDKDNAFSTGSPGPAGTYDIESIATHEILHCFGLDHSPIAGRFNAATGKQVDGFHSGDFSPQSSLFPLGAPQEISGRTLEPDDIAALSTVYPNGGDFGSISGTVRHCNGNPVIGAHVVAVPVNDPTLPLVGRLAGVYPGDTATGAYKLAGLPPGDYFVRIEPLDGTSNSFTDPEFDTTFPPEFYSGAAESESDADINMSDAVMVTVTAGMDTSGINIITNNRCLFASCAATTAVQGMSDAADTLALLYRFRDEVLARTPRGQHYTQQFYQFSDEVVRILLSNPSLLLRTQQMLEHYKSVIASMVNQRAARGRLADLKQINDLLKAYEAGGSQPLQSAVEPVRRDLRDSKVQAEFGVRIATARSSVASVVFQSGTGGSRKGGSLELPGLVLTDYENDQVKVLLSNGDGSFQQNQLIPVSHGPSALAAADFNRDGRTDVVTVNELSHDLSILLGAGEGKFSRARSILVGSQPSAVVVGDFTSDGRLDLAVADAVDNDIRILKGRGDGSFEPGRSIAAGTGPSSMVTGDFNGDGRLDLVVSNFDSNDLTVLLGRGDGSFTRSGTFAVGQGQISLTTGDFDADGRLEIAVANFTSNDLTILKVGERRGVTVLRRLPVGEGPVALVAGEFVTGRLGLAAANLISGEITIWLPDERGVFNRQRRYAVTPAPSSLSLSDFNRDGRPDLAILDADGVTLRVLLNNGDGTFRRTR